MGALLSGLAKQSFQQTLGNQTLQQQPKDPQSNFESQLQKGENTPKTAETPATPEQSPQLSGQGLQNQLEQMQQSLTKSYKQIGFQNNQITEQLPNLINGQTRTSYLQEALQGIKNNPATKDLKGYAMQVEDKWKEVEGIMNSKDSLSQGQLLALQARLYQVSQHIEVMSKVVDQMAGGIKTVLNTNV